MKAAWRTAEVLERLRRNGNHSPLLRVFQMRAQNVSLQGTVAGGLQGQVDSREGHRSSGCASPPAPIQRVMNRTGLAGNACGVPCGTQLVPSPQALVNAAAGLSLLAASAAALAQAAVLPRRSASLLTTVFTSCALVPCSACSARAVCAECCHHSPMQTAVVLKTPVRPNSLTRGATRTVLCQEVVQASKEHLRRHECVRAVKAKSGRAALLKLSRSLSDMDQKPESAAQTFSYVERTCSEGKLTHGQEQCLMLGTFCRKEKKPFPPRPFTRSNSKLSYFRSLSAHYAGVPGPGTTHSAIHIPLLEDRCDGESSRGKKLLSYIVSFSRNCSASSHELDSYFQAEKSSSVLVESAGFCSDDMGDDDVFEDSSSVRLKMTELRAPLCSVEKDSDLDCPSLLSENFPPLSPVSASGDACRICHCEGDEESPLIAPCRCTGSLNFVHQACLQHWIKSSDTRCCELCKYEFVMETKLKPWRKWEKLQMTSSERRKIICSVTFHVIAITCVIWSLYVLIDRTADEIKQGESTGILEWPFWTKLVVVAIGFTGGILFMYVQCKVYMQLWKRLKAYNRVIYVQNCPEASKKSRCEKPVQVEPNLENSGALLGYHAETNGSHYPEPEGPQANFLHI